MTKAKALPKKASREPALDRQSARGRDTRALILDAAEALFSVHGYDGVSMRGITNRAGVRLALATYHFNTKESLFESIIARRAEVLNDRRLAALNALLNAGKPSVEQILTAFIKPYLDLRVSRDLGWRNYSLLIAQLAQINRWLPLVDKYFNPTAREFQKALCAALPDMSRELVSRCFVFCIQLMVSELAGNERIDTLSRGALKGNDVKQVYSDLVAFLVGGFDAILARARQAAADRPRARGA
jgi:AcrR family transcriptional regulator